MDGQILRRGYPVFTYTLHNEDPAVWAGSALCVCVSPLSHQSRRSGLQIQCLFKSLLKTFFTTMCLMHIFNYPSSFFVLPPVFVSTYILCFMMWSTVACIERCYTKYFFLCIIIKWQLHLTFESFSRCSYPEQLTGPIRVKCLAQGYRQIFSPSRLWDSNQLPFSYWSNALKGSAAMGPLPLCCCRLWWK
jgi:hypothetical protein